MIATCAEVPYRSPNHCCPDDCGLGPGRAACPLGTVQGFLPMPGPQVCNPGFGRKVVEPCQQLPEPPPNP